MITARTASGARRTRRPAGRLRLLWLAALLFALVYTHAAGAESASAHVTGGGAPVAPAARLAVPEGSEAAAAVGAGHHDDAGGGHAHAAETCASGHPQQGAELPAPGPLPLGDLSPAGGAAGRASWAAAAPSCPLPLRSPLGSVVQQV